jgi:hypothetical protein
MDERVRKGTLANGLTYYVLPHRKPEHRAQLWLAVTMVDLHEGGLTCFYEHSGHCSCAGISGRGRSAEERYRLITGATRPTKSGYGDAELNGTYVEVKKASAGTLNQVRAVKYIPLVALHEPTATWFVVPAHIVVCLVSTKGRGQHTENPFESATLNVFALGKYEVAETDLKKATLKAIAEANKYPELKAAMARVLAESKALADRSTKSVKELVVSLKIVP